MGKKSATLTRMLPGKAKGFLELSRFSGKSAAVAALALRSTAVLALFWMGHSLATLAWILLPEPEVSPANLQLAANRAVLDVAAAERRRGVDMDLLLRLPFSQGTAPGGLSSDRHAATVTTGLALVLKGTVPSSDTRASRAIIAEGERQSVVHAGEPLPISTAGVSLAEVFTDRVVLDNNGRAEVLWMDVHKAGGDRAPASMNEVRPVPMPPDAAFQTGLPAALSDILSATPQLAGNGKLGLRLKSTGNGRLFRRLGFRNDDIVIAINGMELQEGMAPAELSQALQGSSTARLSILRNEQLLELNTDLSLLD